MGCFNRLFRSLTAGLLLAAFSGSHGVAPAPVRPRELLRQGRAGVSSLRPSLEGVQSGLEENLRPETSGSGEGQGSFRTSAEVLRYILDQKILPASFVVEVRKLGKAGRLVDAKGIALSESHWQNFFYVVNALKRFFDVRPDLPVTLESVQSNVPAPPMEVAGLASIEDSKLRGSALKRAEGAVLRAALASGRKPVGLTWNDYIKLFSLADEAYEGVSGRSIEYNASAVDHLGEKPDDGDTVKNARKYLALFRAEWQWMMEKYFESLPPEVSPTLEGFTLHFLSLALDDFLPRSRRGRKSFGPDGKPLKGLAPSTFLSYLPMIAHELFLPAIQGWAASGLEEMIRSLGTPEPEREELDLNRHPEQLAAARAA